MSGSKHVARPPARSRWGVLAAILAAAILVLGGVSYALVSFTGNGEDPQAGTDPASSDADAGESSDGSDDDPDKASDEPSEGQGGDGGGDVSDVVAEADEEALTACINGIEAAETAVDAADTGIGHLQRHVGAYEDWVAGKISEDTKSKRYAASRKRGPADIERMENASVALADVTDEANDACAEVVEECATRLSTLETAVDAGKVGVAHWEEHLTNMEIFGGGKMSETRAQSLWDTTRAEMPEKVGPWEDASEALDDAPKCPA